jgi:ankyrin repeat protein
MFAQILFVFLFALPLVRADGWDSFSDNLATDLAPFLSLFGEQITKQYLSESLSKLDYFIFAMAPMGILTGLVSAIRVCGNPSLRAFIGRAQEGAGNAEAELCSSTSRDVCELYNSGGIARVFGRPKILEVVHDPNFNFSQSTDETAGIYTFQEYVRVGGRGIDVWHKKKARKTRKNLKGLFLWHEEKATKANRKQNDLEEAPPDLDRHTKEHETPFTEFAPNLSLNIGIKKQQRTVFWAIALLGLILQSGVLIFAIFVTYYLKWGKDGSSPESYACPLTLIGTLLVCGGMFHCASLVGQSTKEDVWHRKKNTSTNPSMYWIQPGGQIVGDQTFDAFSYTDCDNKLEIYTTSRREHGSDETIQVWVAIGATISGFVLQFTGLRGIHSAVSVAQLGVVMIMSMARAVLRMQRLQPEDNHFANFPDEVIGHELDWLALRLCKDVIEKDTKKDTNSPSSGSLSSTSSSRPPPATPSSKNECRLSWRPCSAPDTNKISLQRPPLHESQNSAALLLAYRTRLASLTDSSSASVTPARDFKSEMVVARSESRQLAVLIEATVRTIFSKAVVKEERREEWEKAQSMFWGIDCTLSDQNNGLSRSDPSNKQTIYLEFVRRDPEKRESPWILKNHLQLEGILGLWVWSLKSDPAVEIKDSVTGLKTSTAGDIQAQRIVSNDPAMKRDLDIWLGDDSDNLTEHDLDPSSGDASIIWKKMGKKTVQHKAKYTSSARSDSTLIRFFGWKAAQSQGSEASTVWSAPVKGSLVSPCAQELFTLFLASILDIVDDIGRVNVQTSETIRLENTLVTDIVGLFTEMQLGSRQEALICIMPLMIPRLKMPSAGSALAAARKSANPQQGKEWTKAESVLQWAWNICIRSQASDTNTIEGDEHEPDQENVLAEKATFALCELYRWALVDETTSAFGREGIFGLKKEKSSTSVRKVIDRYVDLADRIALPKASNVSLLANMEQGDLDSALLLLTHPASKVDNEQKGKALFSAAKYGWDQVVLALLRSINNPDFRDDIGRTPLSYAAQKGYIDVVRELLDGGSFPNSEDTAHRTPLSYASEAGSHIVTELLLSDNRVSDSRDNDGRTPLWWAAAKGHEAIVEQLVKLDSVDPDAKDKDGQTPLLLAAQKGYNDVVKLLLKTEKVNPDAEDSYGRTPLLLAALSGHEAVVKLLLQTKRVEPNAKDSYGRTPLCWAAENGHEAVVKALLEIDKVDPNAKNDSGQTPLLLAAQKGYKDVVKMLLQTKKVEPDAKDIDGQTPLCRAARWGYKDVVTLLLEIDKVDPDAKDKDGQTPLLLAAQKGHKDVVKLLLKIDKVDPDVKNKDGQTPLWLAAQQGNEAVVKLLLEIDKIDPDTKDKSGQTPLCWAAKSGDKNVVALLLQTQRVDPDAKDNNGRTPLWWAAERGYKAVITLLLQTQKVEPDAKDIYGQTPLLLSAQRGHKDPIIKLPPPP